MIVYRYTIVVLNKKKMGMPRFAEASVLITERTS